jgi:hypothetical protein
MLTSRMALSSSLYGTQTRTTASTALAQPLELLNWSIVILFSHFRRTASSKETLSEVCLEDSLLYFTDGISSPKKINVSRAIRGGYSGVLNTGSDSEKLRVPYFG